MGLANQEIRDAIDSFAAERLGSRRLPALLDRTDAILTELETLNLMEVRSTPPPLRAALMALVAELPFEYLPRIGPRPSPTAAIEVVFDIQEGLFNLMYGTQPSEQLAEPPDQLTETPDQLTEVAS
jgi:hypothetical protein